jgi:hypothetical protein
MRIALFLTALALLVGSGGCAWMDEDNRHLLNAADEMVKPQEPAAQVALAPVFIPVGGALLVTDALVVHPLSVIGPALEDTNNFVWRSAGQSDSGFREVLLLGPRIIGTPVIFFGDWLARSLFAID